MAGKCGPSRIPAAAPSSASPCDRRPKPVASMPDRLVHILDDERAVRQSLAFLLGSAGLTVRLYDSASAFLAGLSAVKSGCLLTRHALTDVNSHAPLSAV